jgi:hypothetical protein
MDKGLQRMKLAEKRKKEKKHQQSKLEQGAQRCSTCGDEGLAK